MCVTCGCGQGAETELTLHDDEHVHGGHTHLSNHGHSHDHGAPGGHGHDHEHSHDHTHPPFHSGNARAPTGPMVPGRDRRSIALESQVLAKNQLIAERNRGWLSGRGILALNLVSSPGAGKTTLLERTLVDLRDELKMAVIEGDQATSNDAQRILATGTCAVQINTGTGCHLEADMLERALHLLPAEPNSLLFIENVGNLVCPALFDLGEHSKVVIFSVTEGEDKPLKYPHMFAAASLVLLSKTDLLPHLRFESKRAVENALSVNPDLELLEVSAYSGVGLDSWYTWLRRNLAAQEGS